MQLNFLRVIFLLCFLTAAFAKAAVYEVSTTQELRAALASAAADGGDNTIRLALGTYSTQADGEGTFEYISTKDSILSIVGSASSQTILDGGDVEQVFFTLINDAASFSANLSDFTIQKGFNTSGSGGAVNFDQGIATLANMIFKNNRAVENGGAVMSSGSVVITDSDLSVNEAAGEGGAVCARGWQITDSRFHQNKAGIGGALSQCGRLGNTETLGSVFTNNSASSFGGVIWPYACNGTHIIKGNEFRDNSANGYGVGILCKSTIGNLFINNSATFKSVGWTEGNFVNNILVTNVTGDGGIDAEHDLEMTAGGASNNLFFGTSLKVPNSVGITNNIFLQNNTDLFASSGQDFYPLSHNYIDTSKLSDDIILDGTGNIFEGANLSFVNSNEQNFLLLSTSDLIDAGTNGVYHTDYDFTGAQSRVIGSNIDIGPYEFASSSPTILSFGVSGELRVRSTITFTFEIAAADVDAGVTTYFDFGDGEEEIAEGGEYMFEAPASYTVRLIVVNEEGARSSRTLSFDIRDLTLEEKLAAAEQAGRDSVIDNPALYDFITTTELERRVQAAYETVKNDPASYGIDIGFDIDGDGEAKPLTDGLLLIRYLFGFSGDSLVSGAIGSGAERDTAEEVETYIKERVPVQ